jgi:DNA-binding NarL/FixJ family response regulator
MRVVISEDHVLLREGLANLLTASGFEVVAQAGDGEQLLRAVEEHRPDVVICDVRMPPTFTHEGIQAALLIRSQSPGTAVLVLSQYVEEHYAIELVARDTSRLGYLLKDRLADVDDFIEAVRRVGEGGTALDPEVITRLLMRSRRREQLAALSEREQDVLRLMAEGRTNSAIADAMFVSGSAVEKHISNIFAKLGLAPTDTVHRRVLAVVRYLEP